MSPKKSEPKPKTEIAERRPAPPVPSFDRLFDELWERTLAPFGSFPFGGEFAAWAAPFADHEPFWRAAPTDVVDTGKAYRIVAELPGIPKGLIDIRVRGTSVQIRAEKTTDTTREGPEYLHRDRTYTGFRRAFELPEPVVAAEARAKVEDGVLELELPKAKPAPAESETHVKVA